MFRFTSIITLVLCTLLGSGCATGSRQTAPLAEEEKQIPATQTVVFIHGMYMTPDVWSDWQTWFSERGYITYAPPWPLHEVSVKEQNNQHPSKQLGQLTLNDILENYRQFIATLDEPPIVIGHSMGGLIAQKLLEEGITAGAVAVNSAPPKGVLSFKFSFIRANLPHLNLFLSSDIPSQLSLSQFSYGFANDMSTDDQAFFYENFIVPESRKVGRAPLGSSGKINYTTAREPLLIIAGGNDHIIPASLNRSNYKKYRKSPSITDFVEFEGRNHLTVLQPGWQTVTEYIDGWITQNRSNH